MINTLYIVRPTQDDVISAYQVFETAIADAFEKEGLGSEQEFINSETMQKKHLLNAAIVQPNLDIDFLVAKLDGIVVGTISFGSCGEHIRKCTEKRCHRFYVSIVGKVQKGKGSVSSTFQSGLQKDKDSAKLWEY